MAVKFTTQSDYLGYTGTMPAIAPFTVFFRVRWDDLSAAHHTIFSRSGDSDPLQIGTSNAGTVMQIWDNTSAVDGTTTLVSGAWNRVAYTIDSGGTVQKLYLNEKQEATMTSAPTLTGSTGYYLSTDVTAFAQFGACTIQDLRIWTAELSLPELTIERDSGTPSRLANLWDFWTLTDENQLAGLFAGKTLAWTGTPLGTDSQPLGGSPADDRYRFRPSHFHGGGTSTRGSHRSAWSDDARDRGLRDTLRDNNARMF